ncbi:MAG: acyl-CoA dehydrogenase family protein [Chloroflexi bacterium]|nr:acyl-CoA dehydrogenase family protein [Chloroflexota bacterium]
MDFRFSKEDEDFRQEVRDFIVKEWLPVGADGGGESVFSTAIWPKVQELRKKLAALNWIAISWPKEYGGMGASLVKQAIFKEEMAYWRCPGIDPQAYQFGPAVIMHGTEEQKKKYLGGIARSEVVWCQGFSEPDAGSDLASLQTRAVQDGDDFIINGQKIWTSGAHLADYIHMLARTDPDAPKHRGISYFIFPMTLPGITVKPIAQMTGGEGFNEVYFDNVRIPKDSLFGELNRGWYVATTTLDFERSNVAGAAGAQRSLEDLVKFCKATKHNGGRLFDDPQVRYRLANTAIEVAVGRNLSYRVLWMQDQGMVPNMEASIAKMFSVDVSATLAGRSIEIMGLFGQLGEGSRWSPMKGGPMRGYLATACKVGGGSQEIMKNIIAQRGLGLPR